MTAKKFQGDLRKKGSKAKAKNSSWFFKTGAGQYGYGDVFIGVTVPEVRSIAKKYLHLSNAEIKKMLQSPVHEDRLAALMVLVEQYRKVKDLSEKKKLAHFYLSLKKGINNWDLVDLSSYKILGAYCFESRNTAVLKKLIRSKRHWDRRLAMVATFAFIRKNDLKIVFDFASQVLKDSEDLMHKASGWMLREAGKRNSKQLLTFIDKYGPQMPRTMLRYSIEKFSKKMRREILANTRK
jgi:3-methyladenine DNA glycosylase AlkD